MDYDTTIPGTNIGANFNDGPVDPPQPKKKTRSATKTRAAGHEGAGLHYKQVRTTIVLLKNSATFKREFTAPEQAAVCEIEKLNFDLSAATDLSLEHVFAKLDEETMQRVREEYEFVPRVANIRNHFAPVATCALCGKGDSKDDGSNADKLQYDFRLQNHSGGEDLWVGRSCIVNFGLKVAGAGTSTEARAILDRQLRECMALWMKEAWRNDHPDHASMFNQFERLQSFSFSFKRYYRYGRQENEISLLGCDQGDLNRRIWVALKALRNAVRFYRRSDYLTESKTSAWRQAKALLKSLEWLAATLDAGVNVSQYDRREFFIKERAKREVFLLKQKIRTPRPLPEKAVA